MTRKEMTAHRIEYYKKAFGVLEHVCKDCGMTLREHFVKYGANLQVHHIDINHMNNDIINLELLCCVCHNRKHRRNNNLKPFQRKDGLKQKRKKKIFFEVEKHKLNDRPVKEYDSKRKTKEIAINKYSLDGFFLKRYNNIYDLVEKGFTRQAIMNCCRGKSRKSQGFIWKFDL